MMRKIRPLAIGLFRHDGQLLAVEARDPATGAQFCRPLGGEIEFGEAASEALAREVVEELGEGIRDVELLGVLENRFEYGGAPGHEVVFVFDCSFADPAVYRRLELNVGDEASGAERVARWYSIESLAAGDPPLYPVGLAELAQQAPRRVSP